MALLHTEIPPTCEGEAAPAASLRSSVVLEVRWRSGHEDSEEFLDLEDARARLRVLMNKSQVREVSLLGFTGTGEPELIEGAEVFWRPAPGGRSGRLVEIGYRTSFEVASGQHQVAG